MGGRGWDLHDGMICCLISYPPNSCAWFDICDVCRSIDIIHSYYTPFSASDPFSSQKSMCGGGWIQQYQQQAQTSRPGDTYIYMYIYIHTYIHIHSLVSKSTSELTNHISSARRPTWPSTLSATRSRSNEQTNQTFS